MKTRQIVRLSEERQRVDAVTRALGAGPRSFAFIGDLLLQEKALVVSLPALGEVLVVDLRDGRILRRIPLLREGSLTPHDQMRLIGRGETLVIALRSRLSHGGDPNVDLYLFENAVRRAFHIPQREEPEMRWALSDDGVQLLTVEANAELTRLHATVRAAATGKKVTRFRVGDEDEVYCGAVAIEPGGRRAAFAHETGVLLYDLEAKKASPIARWKPPADQLSALYFSRRRNVLLGVEETSSPRVWVLDVTRAPKSIVAGRLPTGRGSRCLRISADGAKSFWLGRSRGSRAWSVFRLEHHDGACQRATVDLGNTRDAPAVAIDARSRQIAVATADGVRIEPLGAFDIAAT